MNIPPKVKTEKKLAPRNWTDDSPSEIPVYVARPDDDHPVTRPAIMLFQEAFGVNEHIQDVCIRFARAGYVVVSPDLYYRTGHWKDYAYGDFQATAKPKEHLTEHRVLGDIQATLDYICALEHVDSTQIGAIGYCLGGRMTYIAACEFPERIQAAALYYGGGLTKESEQFPAPIVQKTDNMKAPFIAFFGGEDQGIPLEHVQQVESALQDAHVVHNIYLYPQAGHGFFCDQRDKYDPVAAQDAWYKTLTFFEKTLGPVPHIGK